ncbi:hypothetical protein [Pseudanabaena minima]|uniref:hypothetical protein n=1 Tax=Pseudanabaena minima TaxID=890415 RepID=UPI003DA8A5D7
MFEYIIHVPFPLKLKDCESDEISWMKVAQYNFDPGLQIDEEINLSTHFGGWGDKPFFFKKARVVRKDKIVISQKGGDIFRIDVFVEIADKEDLVRMREILRKLNPGKFED